MVNPGYFEALDLFDLWCLCGNLKQASSLRRVSAAKVSRRVAEFIDRFNIDKASSPGLDASAMAFESESLTHLRRAYQYWRFDIEQIKVYPTFATAALFRDFEGSVDLMLDRFHRPEELREHLVMRRVDLIVSSSLDIAGNLLAEALETSQSLLMAVPLFREPIHLLFNPDHPLSDASVLSPGDLKAFSSPAYPSGVAPLAADVLKPQGLWTSTCRHQHFVLSDWYGAMRYPTGLSYSTALLEPIIPDVTELICRALPQPVEQETWIILLKDTSENPSVKRLIEQLRFHAFRVLASCSSPWTSLDQG